MEDRKITLITGEQTNTLYMGEGTLRDLKAHIEKHRILTNLSFSLDQYDYFEGISGIKLIDDTSVLPIAIPYKGQITNELVIIMSVKNEKIKLGMNRKEVLNRIKELNLGMVVKDIMGRNCTQVSTEKLIEIIENHTIVDPVPQEKASCNSCCDPTTMYEHLKETRVEAKDRGIDINEVVESEVEEKEEKCVSLLDKLSDISSKIDKILEILEKSNTFAPITASDIANIKKKFEYR